MSYSSITFTNPQAHPSAAPRLPRAIPQLGAQPGAAQQPYKFLPSQQALSEVGSSDSELFARSIPKGHDDIQTRRPPLIDQDMAFALALATQIAEEPEIDTRELVGRNAVAEGYEALLDAPPSSISGGKLSANGFVPKGGYSKGRKVRDGLHWGIFQRMGGRREMWKLFPLAHAPFDGACPVWDGEVTGSRVEAERVQREGTITMIPFAELDPEILRAQMDEHGDGELETEEAKKYWSDLEPITSFSTTDDLTYIPTSLPSTFNPDADLHGSNKVVAVLTRARRSKIDIRNLLSEPTARRASRQLEVLAGSGSSTPTIADAALPTSANSSFGTMLNASHAAKDNVFVASASKKLGDIMGFKDLAGEKPVVEQSKGGFYETAAGIFAHKPSRSFGSYDRDVVGHRQESNGQGQAAGNQARQMDSFDDFNLLANANRTELQAHGSYETFNNAASRQNQNARFNDYTSAGNKHGPTSFSSFNAMAASSGPTGFSASMGTNVGHNQDSYDYVGNAYNPRPAGPYNIPMSYGNSGATSFSTFGTASTSFTPRTTGNFSQFNTSNIVTPTPPSRKPRFSASTTQPIISESSASYAPYTTMGAPSSSTQSASTQPTPGSFINHNRITHYPSAPHQQTTIRDIVAPRARRPIPILNPAGEVVSQTASPVYVMMPTPVPSPERVANLRGVIGAERPASAGGESRGSSPGSPRKNGRVAREKRVEVRGPVLSGMLENAFNMPNFLKLP